MFNSNWSSKYLILSWKYFSQATLSFECSLVLILHVQFQIYKSKFVQVYKLLLNLAVKIIKTQTCWNLNQDIALKTWNLYEKREYIFLFVSSWDEFQTRLLFYIYYSNFSNICSFIHNINANFSMWNGIHFKLSVCNKKRRNRNFHYTFTQNHELCDTFEAPCVPK